MHIDKVHAISFGPLAGECLLLAPGMTVIVGDNESAKTTWHAALYAALCGRRRAKGSPTREERRFSDLHRPWNDDRWIVAAELTLADGRHIALSHDLDGKVDCRALDVDLSRDVSNEIVVDGSPDGSHWLGLDRRSFASTACVNQAELLKVLDEADGLQDHLQRAAATAGTDATAAVALKRLEDFHREQIGRDQANSTKPLRRAKQRLEATSAVLSDAHRLHQLYLDQLAAADYARKQAAATAAYLKNLDAAAAAAEATLALAQACTPELAELRRLSEQAETTRVELAEADAARVRIGELQDRFGGHPPVGSSAGDASSAAVAAALASYAAAPPPVPLAGSSSAQLRAELAAVPDAGEGDEAADPQVRAAVSRYEQARLESVAHQHTRPPEPPALSQVQAAAVAVGTDALRELASSAPAPAGVRDGAIQAAAIKATEFERALQEQVTQLRYNERRLTDAAESWRTRVADLTAAARVQEQLAAASRSRDEDSRAKAKRAGSVLLVAGLLMAIAGAGAFLTGIGVGLAALVIGLVVAAVGVATRKRAGHVPVLAAAGPAIGVGGVDLAAAVSQLAQADAALHDAAEHTRRAEAELLTANAEQARAQVRAEAEEEAATSVAAAMERWQDKCAAVGLPADPAGLRQLCVLVDRLSVEFTALGSWQSRATALDETLADARTTADRALDGCGAPAGDDPAQRFAGYESECGHRASNRRLTRELESRDAAELAFEQQRTRRERAEQQLREVAAEVQVGDPTADADSLVASLATWRQQRSAAMASAEREQQDWAELQVALAGRSWDEVCGGVEAALDRHEEAVRSREHAQCRATEALRQRDESIASLGVELGGADEPNRLCELLAVQVRLYREQRDAARADASTAAADAADADGVLRERARTLVPVADAEEAVAAADTELRRVAQLADTIGLTIRFLEAAQQRVHRDIAPVLAATLTQWLPLVTAGRYVQASVDPQTLKVKVCGADRNWRDADRLSHGTTEQVYLLLRMALARHLVNPNEISPLLLDDVTAQADAKRTVEILELLHVLSEQQQVIVFAAQQQVADWARQALTGPRDAVHELQPVLTT